MIMVLFMNTTSNELQNNVPITQSLLKLLNLIRESPVSKSFSSFSYIDSVEVLLEFAKQTKSKSEVKLFTLLKGEDKNVQLARVMMKSVYKKELEGQL
jgi:hypothetical protein